jgi:hypothetical protein
MLRLRVVAVLRFCCSESYVEVTTRYGSSQSPSRPLPLSLPLRNSPRDGWNGSRTLKMESGRTP